jgi:hypothetical protein
MLLKKALESDVGSNCKNLTRVRKKKGKEKKIIDPTVV